MWGQTKEFSCGVQKGEKNWQEYLEKERIEREKGERVCIYKSVKGQTKVISCGVQRGDWVGLGWRGE